MLIYMYNLNESKWKMSDTYQTSLSTHNLNLQLQKNQHKIGEKKNSLLDRNSGKVKKKKYLTKNRKGEGGNN